MKKKALSSPAPKLNVPEPPPFLAKKITVPKPAPVSPPSETIVQAAEEFQADSTAAELTEEITSEIEVEIEAEDEEPTIDIPLLELASARRASLMRGATSWGFSVGIVFISLGLIGVGYVKLRDQVAHFTDTDARELTDGRVPRERKAAEHLGIGMQQDLSKNANPSMALAPPSPAAPAGATAIAPPSVPAAAPVTPPPQQQTQAEPSDASPSAYQAPRPQDENWVTVVANSAVLRAGPGTNFRKVGLAQSELKLLVEEQRGDWFKVREASNDAKMSDRFWIRNDLVRRVAKNDPSAQEEP